GIQRGRPPKPARKPSFGPLPFFQTRDEKPFSSTVKVSGSATTSSHYLDRSRPGRKLRARRPRSLFCRYSAAKAAGWNEAGEARSARAIGRGHHRSSHSEKT